jgi:hypothetical protein
MYAGLRAPTHRTADLPQNVIDEVNPIARVFGSSRFSIGPSFDWCREPASGNRHAFSYDFFDIGVLFDLFEPKQYRAMPNEIRAEVAEKVAAIERRNAVSDQPIGYMAVVRGYVARPAEIEDVKMGFVCSELRVGPIPDAPVDRYDSARAATGDIMAGAAPGFVPRNWNKPQGWTGAALAGTR